MAGSPPATPRVLHDRLGWRVVQVGSEAHCISMGTQPLIIAAWIATGIACLGAIQLSILPVALPQEQRWIGVVVPGALLLTFGALARYFYNRYRRQLAEKPAPAATVDLVTGDVRDERGQTVGNFLTDRLERRRNWTYRTPGFIGYLVVRGPTRVTRLAQGDRSDLETLERQLRDLCEQHAAS